MDKMFFMIYEQIRILSQHIWLEVTPFWILTFYLHILVWEEICQKYYNIKLQLNIKESLKIVAW